MRRGRSFHRQRSASFFDFGTSDCYQFFLAYGPGLQALATNAHNSLLDQNIEHDTFDRYWQDGDIAKHLHNIHCAVLNVGGSFDAEDLAGTFRTYHAIRKENPALTNMLVIGPWGHGDWLRSAGRKLGPLDFESDTGTWFRNQVLFSFFEHYLKNAPMPDIPGCLHSRQERTSGAAILRGRRPARSPRACTFTRTEKYPSIPQARRRPLTTSTSAILPGRCPTSSILAPTSMKPTCTAISGSQPHGPTFLPTGPNHSVRILRLRDR